jgi:catechol 2,3-dioxygenase-like lactoylglutathione lyase family enzyme
MIHKPRLVLKVNDMNQSKDFYTSVLEWVQEKENTNSSICQFRLPSGDAAILITDEDVDFTDWMDVAYDKPSSGQRVYLHGYSIEAFKKKVEYELVVEQGFGQTLMFQDPNGYVISLWEELYLPDEDIIELYKKGPQLLEEAIVGLTEKQYDLVRAPGKWSIREIVLHLIDSDLTTANRLKYALAEPGRVYYANPYAPNEWVSGTHYSKRSIDTEVKLFRYMREHILSLCQQKSAPLDQYVITDNQKVVVRQTMKMVAGHARGHINQILETRKVYGV